MVSILFLFAIGVLILLDVLLFAVWDKYVFSFVLLLGLAVLAWYQVPFVYSFVETTGYLKLFAEYLPLYLLVGAVVAAAKWGFLVLSVAGDIKEIRQSYIENAKKKRGVDVGPLLKTDPAEMRGFLSAVAHTGGTKAATVVYDNTSTFNFDSNTIQSSEDVLDAVTPRAKRNVERITFWALQWPIVIISTLVEDFLVKIGKHLSKLFDYLFTRVARKILARALNG